MYGIETKLWKEKERSRAVQMENLKSGLLGIRRMDNPLECKDKEVVLGRRKDK